MWRQYTAWSPPPPPTMPWPSRNKILIRVNICVQLYLIINCFNVRPWQIKKKTKHKTVPNTKAWSDDEGFLLNHLMSIKIQTETDAHITDEYTRQSLQIDTKIHTVLQEDGLCVCSKIFSGGNIPLVHSSTVIFKYNPSPPAVDSSRSDLRIAAGISLTLYKIKRPDTRRRPETHVSTWNHRLYVYIQPPSEPCHFLPFPVKSIDAPWQWAALRDAHVTYSVGVEHSDADVTLESQSGVDQAAFQRKSHSMRLCSESLSNYR